MSYAGWDVPVLLHFAGTAGSTTITNSNAAGPTFAATVSGQIDTAQSKFGGSALFTNGFDGGAEANSDFYLPGAFCFEQWCWVDDATRGGFAFAIGDQQVTTRNAFGLRLANTALRLHINDGGNDVWVTNSPQSTFTDHTWFKVAVIRDERDFMYVTFNGYLIAPVVKFSGVFAGHITSAGRLNGGSWSGTGYFHAYYDELRVTRGHPRYRIFPHAVEINEFGYLDSNVDPIVSMKQARFRRLISPPSGALTIGLTGVTGTASIVNPGINISVAANAQTGTGSVGTISPGAGPALPAQTGTGSVGALSPAVTAGISGPGATGSVGTVTANTSTGNVTVGLPGVTSSGSVTALGPQISKSLNSILAVNTLGYVTSTGGTFTTTGIPWLSVSFYPSVAGFRSVSEYAGVVGNNGV